MYNILPARLGFRSAVFVHRKGYGVGTSRVDVLKDRLLSSYARAAVHAPSELTLFKEISESCETSALHKIEP